MAVFAKVFHKRSETERIITVKSYEFIKESYKLLGYVDEKGNAVDGPNSQQPRSQPAQRSAEPVAHVKPTAEEITARRAELEEMNKKALEKASEKEELVEDDVTIEKKKRGRPKVNA
jgi:hypothetical protein